MAIATLSYASDALAAPDVDVSVDYVVDAVTVSQPGAATRLYALDNLDLIATLDLGALAGIGDTTLHAHVLNNLGGMPNNRAGTLQGIDNIEVSQQRLRLFELWAEHRIGGRTTVRAGLYDLNSEFYANDAAGLLIHPAFGVGSEIAATGPNGPSIFPSTALAVRVEHRPREDRYVRLAVVNARAGTLGDPQGVDLGFGKGALAIGEVGLERDGKIALGAWTYSSRQPHVRRVRADGSPAMAQAYGLYATLEWPLLTLGVDRSIAGFVRLGASDGHTTPFCGGWQAGLLWQGVLAGRADSALSLGANQGRLSRGYRRLLREQGARPAAAETALEVTASDRLMRHVTLQPGLQLVLDPGGVRQRGRVLVGSLRVTFDF
jgi:porin